jgi:hypothetical protein
VAEVILPQAGTNLKGWKLGWVDSGAKTAQNDTWTVTNATEVKQAWLQIDASGVAEPYTVSTNVIVLTSATGTAASGLILFR